MLEREINDCADERAVEAAVTAENENDEHGGGAIETEGGEVDVGVGLRRKTAGDAGERRREGVTNDESMPHR